jgi:hypothetical protein
MAQAQRGRGDHGTAVRPDLPDAPQIRGAVASISLLAVDRPQRLQGDDVGSEEMNVGISSKFSIQMIWVRILCVNGKLINFANLVSEPLSGSIASG